MKQITILGSTGSIGINTLDVISRHVDKYSVFAISAWNNIDLLFEQILAYHPKYAVVSTLEQANILQTNLNASNKKIATIVKYGIQGLCEIAEHECVDIVMAAIVGSAGLAPTFAAAKAGKKILLANKESLVASGELLTTIAQQNNAQILPVDSEHNAVYQCYEEHGKGVKSIILTASGGPFLHKPIQEWEGITPDMACKHPKWSMGRKISVDSATMMNKGLEIIEAFWLFPQAQNNIKVVVHPQSIVHSLVEYVDGSVLAQISYPDMRIPIAYSLAYPDRIECGARSLDISTLSELNFYPPDMQKFKCLQLAIDCLATKQCISLNAANEIAVDAFLRQEIAFIDIPSVIDSVLSSYSYDQPVSIDDVLEIDAYVRQISKQHISNFTH